MLSKSIKKSTFPSSNRRNFEDSGKVLATSVFECKAATNLENLEKSGNLKETSESQGICLNSQGICGKIPKVREFCCLKFIFSQVEDPNFENFLGEHAPPPKWSRTHGRG